MNVNASSIVIVAPGLIEQTWNEAEVLGSAAWLWMHSAAHRDFPLHTPQTKLPISSDRRHWKPILCARLNYSMRPRNGSRTAHTTSR